MVALIAAALASGEAASIVEVNAIIVPAGEADGILATAGESAEVADEASEAIVGEQGLLEQLDAIHHSSLESVSARNESLLKTRNEWLEGHVHPETGVPYNRVELQFPDGTIREGVFPEFDAKFETILPDELLKASDYKQFNACNEQLRDAVNNDPSMKEKFSEVQLQQIEDGETPDGYTWHHHQETGKMQLVDTGVHMGTPHTGGKVIWGGGR